MDNYELLKTALAIARRAHAGQTDKAGDSYIFHPVLVALQCEGLYEKAAALLHDTIEDSGGVVTAETLAADGIPAEVIAAVELVTHVYDAAFGADYHAEYRAYIRRLKESGNPIAIAVKLADLRMNLDTTRLKGSRPPKYDDYIWAVQYLSA